MNHAREKLEEAIRETIAGAEERMLGDELQLANLGIDSIKYVELLVLLEDKLNMVFDESDLGIDSLRTIGDLAALIEKNAAQNA